MSFTAQFAQFVNQAVFALGNRWPIMLLPDPNTPVNGAPPGVAISSTTLDSSSTTMTVVTSSNHNVNVAGSTIVIYGSGIPQLDGTYTVINVNSSTSLVVYTGGRGESTANYGYLRLVCTPVRSTFVPAFPTWAATTLFYQGSLIIPKTSPNGHYFKAIQGGTTGSTEPVWTTTTNQQYADGTVIWQEAGLVNSAAPPPFGAQSISVYGSALWAFNTKPLDDTTTNLDGPTSLRMSDVNNPNSWNPVNQAFIDKDDGTEGTALLPFTISATGIPPEGSLVLFKQYTAYQVIGIFGASNFAIQRIKTAMGCTAPRTALFVPGFGILRYTHLGFAVFDGVEDRIISEDIRPYLFPSNQQDFSDISVVDPDAVPLAFSAISSQPPMYCCLMGVGQSFGYLTRIFCYDLVTKSWSIVDTPLFLSFLGNSWTETSPPIVLLGGANDGTLQRWQAGDLQWATGATGAYAPSNPLWSVRTPELASVQPDQRIFARRLMVRGISKNSSASISCQVSVGGQAENVRIGGRPSAAQSSSPLAAGTDFEKEFGVGVTSLRFHADISGSGQVEIQGFTWYVVPKSAGVRQRVT